MVQGRNVSRKGAAGGWQISALPSHLVTTTVSHRPDVDATGCAPPSSGPRILALAARLAACKVALPAPLPSPLLRCSQPRRTMMGSEQDNALQSGGCGDAISGLLQSVASAMARAHLPECVGQTRPPEAVRGTRGCLAKTRVLRRAAGDAGPLVAWGWRIKCVAAEKQMVLGLKKQRPALDVCSNRIRALPCPPGARQHRCDLRTHCSPLASSRCPGRLHHSDHTWQCTQNISGQAARPRKALPQLQLLGYRQSCNTKSNTQSSGERHAVASRESKQQSPESMQGGTSRSQNKFCVLW